MTVTLPDVIVERILSIVPFPYVFKARVLSKSWLARFSQIPLQKRRNGASKKRSGDEGAGHLVSEANG